MVAAASSDDGSDRSRLAHPLVDRLLPRCTFPDGGSVVCGLSGGADSTAMTALAVAAGCDVTAVHVDHGLRPSAPHDAATARRTAGLLGVAFEVREVHLDEGPNLEARARTARRRELGPDALLGHTADDQAETVLLALGRGAGATGLAAIRPGPTHPILRLRRADTVELCRGLDLPVADDPTNTDLRFRRNRVRHELLPLLAWVADRDVAPLLNRTADLLRDDDDLLCALAADLDPTDARAVADAPAPLARRAIRRWLSGDGYPPDANTIERVVAVARGDAVACEVGGGRRVERTRQRLCLCEAPDAGRYPVKP